MGIGAAVGAAAGWLTGTAVGRAVFGTGVHHGLSDGTKDFLARAKDVIPGFPATEDAFRTYMSDNLGWSASKHSTIENKIVAEVATGLLASTADNPQQALQQIFSGSHDGPQALLIYLSQNPDAFEQLMQVQGSYKDYFNENGGYGANASHIFHDAIAADRAVGRSGGTDYDKQWVTAEMLRQIFNPQEGTT